MAAQSFRFCAPPVELHAYCRIAFKILYGAGARTQDEYRIRGISGRAARAEACSRSHDLPAARERGRAVLDTDVPHDASSFGWPSPDVAERASRLVLYDALSHEAMGALTTGVFLVGFAVALGAASASGLPASDAVSCWLRRLHRCLDRRPASWR